MAQADETGVSDFGRPPVADKRRIAHSIRSTPLARSCTMRSRVRLPCLRSQSRTARCRSDQRARPTSASSARKVPPRPSRAMRHADRPKPLEHRSRTGGSCPSVPPNWRGERCPETPAALRSRSNNRRASRPIARTPPVPPLGTLPLFVFGEAERFSESDNRP
jgi:hypothetical protein